MDEFEKNELNENPAGEVSEEPVHEEEPSTQSEADISSDYSGGYIDGFMDGLQPGLDAAKENIDEFNRIINGEETTDDQDKE